MSNSMQPSFELLARGVFFWNDALLLCQNKKHGHFYLPGGHIEFGEKAETALTREMTEETGNTPTALAYIGTHEFSFKDTEGEEHHEINIVFSGEIAGDIESKEEHIRFEWIPLSQIQEHRVYPEGLLHAVIEWYKSKERFFKSEI